MQVILIVCKHYLSFKRFLAFLLFAVSSSSIAQDGADIEQLYRSVLKDFGKPAAGQVLRWQEMLANLSELSNFEKVKSVNHYFAQSIDYELDQSVYGKIDYWASLGETLAHSKGDCEDVAIAKYISLRMAGIPDSNLRLMYVKAKTNQGTVYLAESHIVLAYYDYKDSEPYILDSLIPEIKSSSKRLDLKLIYSFNKEGLWLGEKQKYYSKPSEHLSRWSYVLEKTEQQGIQL